MRACLLRMTLIAASAGGAACSDPSAPTPGRQGAPTVCAVNYPLAYFARRIAPPAIEVQFPAP
ncbi:MAG: hypothetical protein GY715_20260, partial [Planctomycetes bacterium]|nr:hypothetical protein [Planctomycetota bacterium]